MFKGSIKAVTMTGYQTQVMARFVVNSRWEHLPDDIIEQLKIIYWMHRIIAPCQRPDGYPELAAQIKGMGEGGVCATRVAGRFAPDLSAQFYTALIRYPDFMDNFLCKEDTSSQ